MMHPKTLWFTGLSGSGKSTLANAVKNKLEEDGCLLKIFDGDEIRKGLNKNLGFSLEDRFENIRRVAEVNKLFLDFGVSTINAFISPTNEIRSMAKRIIGDDRFLEICLTTPLKVCMELDTKGFYKKIKDGKLKDFTGIDSVFEPSASAALYLDTSETPLQKCVEMILDLYHQREC
jgi:adenylylsulfate kinase